MFREKFKKLPFDLVETDINIRWENGADHHPKSEEIIRAIRFVNSQYADCALNVDFGGDGDDGEIMMYLLDVYFDALDKQNAK